VNQFGMTWDDDDRNLRIGASAYTGEYRCNNGQGEGVLTLTVTCKSLDIDCTGPDNKFHAVFCISC